MRISDQNRTCPKCKEPTLCTVERGVVCGRLACDFSVEAVDNREPSFVRALRRVADDVDQQVYRSLLDGDL